MDIGFIGLGRMGAAMAGNLVNAGHRVRVWNRSTEPVVALEALGAVAVASPAEAFDAGVVFSMLADDASVRAVILDGGVLQATRKGVAHVNCATISVALGRELAEAHAAAGLSYLSAPVFGRPDAAANALLHIIVAGDSVVIDRMQPMFDILGQKTWRAGDEPSRANVVKIAGNFMLVAAIEAMGEASALVEGHDVSAGTFLEIMSSTLFASPIYKGYGPVIAERRYEPAGFALTLGLKDVRLALEAGADTSVPLPIASLARDNLLDAIAHGDGKKDWAALADVSRRHAGRA
jgi:3-hydroxyisobutyrate dehydrogenase-like beta-hydroxyacid dehydrogenase